jgi:hypothetical protein
MVFTFLWMLGTTLLLIAAVKAELVSGAGSYFALFLGSIVIGKLVEWFIIEPVLGPHVQTLWGSR